MEQRGGLQPPRANMEIQMGMPRTAFDGLPLPGGKSVGETSSSDIARILIACGVDGVSHENGRGANIEAYGRHMNEVRREGADRAVTDWLNHHNGVAK